MTVPYKLPTVSVSDSDISSYLRKVRLPRTAVNIASARTRIEAQKIQEALPKGKDVSVVQSDAYRSVVYGESLVGGVITFAATSSNNQYLHLVVTFAGHECENIQALYLDDCRVDFSAVPGWCSYFVNPDGSFFNTDVVYLQKNLGSESQDALSELVAANVGWTGDHKQSGCCHCYLGLKWDGSVFGDGIPEIRALIRGKKVYDPRVGYAWYSANAALCIADFLCDARYGLGAATTRVYNSALTTAANICDETVSLISGGSEYRYTCNGSFETTSTPADILGKLAQTIDGRIVYQQGQWIILPATWRSPVLSLSLDDMLSDYRVQTSVSRKELFNRVRGTFHNALNMHTSDNYPIVKNDLYYAQDQNEELYLELNQDFVTSSSTAQRLAKIQLERIRQSLQVEATFGLKAYQCSIGDNVQLTIDELGWTNKTFEIIDLDFIEQGSREGATLATKLILRESASGVFDWNSGEETTHDISPNSSLPNPRNVSVPNNLVLTSGTDVLYLKADGTIVSRLKAEWDAITDAFVASGGKIICQYKKSASVKWASLGEFAPDISEVFIFDVADGTAYDFRVCCRNALGITGGWRTATNHIILGKSEKPSDVTGLVGTVASFGIALDWADVDDLDLSQYEVREGASWGGSTLVATVKASKLDLPIRIAGDHTFLIKARDTSKNYSLNPASVVVTISSPTVSDLASSIDGSEVLITWSSTPGSFAIEDYIIRQGEAFVDGTLVGHTKGTTFRLGATWSGARQLWIAARDVAGNIGTAQTISPTITAPGLVQTPTTEIIDNFVLFRWTVPASGSLPIRGTKLYKVVSGSDVLIGESSGTFFAFFETEGGSYTYKLAVVDIAGNEGGKKSISGVIGQPRDYVFKSSNVYDPDDALTADNIAIVDNIMTLPVNVDETFEEHFTSHSWSTPQDQVNAGYSRFCQPTESTAQFVGTVDLGATVPYGCLVTLTLARSEIVSGITLAPTISVSVDNTSWTDYADHYQIYVSSFRYLKVTLDATGGGTALDEIQEARITVAKQELRDEGSGTAASGDSGGTTVSFNKTFVDVESINVTAKYQAAETKGVTAVYDFTDVPNPTSFKVLLYSNNSGTRISGAFSWHATGS